MDGQLVFTVYLCLAVGSKNLVSIRLAYSYPLNDISVTVK